MSPALSLWEILRGPLEQVRGTVGKARESHVSITESVADYVLGNQGKGVRALLVLASARLCGYEGAKDLLLAAAIELLHVGTLVHDDVIDHSPIRRGRPSVHEAFDTPSAIMGGDFLFVKAFQLMVTAQIPEALDLIAQALQRVIEGEMLELFLHNRTAVPVTRTEVGEVMALKTASFFEAACLVGGVLGGATRSEKQALKHFGHFLGLIFQITDDLLDYTGESDRFGKKIGQDFFEKRWTYPVVLSHAREPAFWEGVFGRGDSLTDADFVRARERLHQTGALEEAYAQISHYEVQALSALHTFPENTLRRALESFLKDLGKRRQ